MKNIISLLFAMLLILTSCNKDDDALFNNSCDFETKISALHYRNAPSDQLHINSLEIIDDCLVIKFTASGCSGDTWEVRLIDSEEVLESFPPQRNLRLSLKNQEDCHAMITKTMSFNLANLKVKGNQVLLNIIHTNDPVLYEY